MRLTTQLLVVFWGLVASVLLMLAFHYLNNEHAKHFPKESKPARDLLRIDAQTVTNEGCWFLIFKSRDTSRFQALHHPACPNHGTRADR